MSMLPLLTLTHLNFCAKSCAFSHSINFPNILNLSAKSRSLSTSFGNLLRWLDVQVTHNFLTERLRDILNMYFSLLVLND